MNRRAFFRTAVAPALSGLPARPQAPADRPNIVLLVADDQRWDTLGCMGNRIIETPAIDRLASDGVTFTNNFVTTSICMTSRASIFTGLYARTHRIYDFQKRLEPAHYAQSYPMLLRKAGYHTGFIGKYGVGNVMPAGDYDHFQGFPGQGNYFPQGRNGKHLTPIMGDQALAFLNGAPKDRPFCLQVSFKAPHVQDQDPKQFLYDPALETLYADATIPAPRLGDPKWLEALPDPVHRSEIRRRWAVRFSTPRLYQESVKAYYRLITGVDREVARIREQLRRIGADRKTVVIYTADNGFYLGERGLAGKWLMHEESIRTPMIVCDPRLSNASRGRRVSRMALNIDVAPTILSLAGVPLPNVQGRDLTPLLRADAAPWRSEWFYDQLFTTNGWIPAVEGVRTERWKYARFVEMEKPFEELYDLQADPGEERNLAADAAARERLEAMRTRWQDWRKHLEAWRVGDRWSDPA
jgi:arylsulfatase A-like enzyme